MNTKLTVGAFTPSVLLAVARQLGKLDEHGVEVDAVAVPSSPAQFRSLLDGEIDVALTSPDNVIAYRFSPHNPLGGTADVSIVSAVDRGMGLALYGRPGVSKGEHLRGASVGVDVPTSGFALALYALADSLGIGRDDYQTVALGSTPQRLHALLAGACDATMLNAGNELIAEQAGCNRLARVVDVSAPYVGTVVSVAGTEHLHTARHLAAALRETATTVLAGKIDDLAANQAKSVLGLPPELAGRYVDRLKDDDEGLITQEEIDMAGLATIVDLRRRYLPSLVDGVDQYREALAPTSGLFAPRSQRR